MVRKQLLSKHSEVDMFAQVFKCYQTSHFFSKLRESPAYEKWLPIANKLDTISQESWKQEEVSEFITCSDIVSLKLYEWHSTRLVVQIAAVIGAAVMLFAAFGRMGCLYYDFKVYLRL